MRVTNPFSVKYWSIGKVIFVFWVLVTTLFTFYVLWNMFLSSSTAYQKGVQEGQQAGQQMIMNQLLTSLQTNKCTPIQVNENTKLIDISCIPQPGQPAPAPASPPATTDAE